MFGWRLFPLVLFLLLLMSIQINAQYDSSSLPDFTKNPYKIVDQDHMQSTFHPEWKLMPAKLYSDSSELMHEGGNYIILYVNDKGVFTYAEWMHIYEMNGPHMRYALRGYTYNIQTKQFILEKEDMIAFEKGKK